MDKNFEKGMNNPNKKTDFESLPVIDAVGNMEPEKRDDFLALHSAGEELSQLSFEMKNAKDGNEYKEIRKKILAKFPSIFTKKDRA